MWFFFHLHSLLFNYLVQDVKFILTLQSGLLSHTDSERQMYQETKNFPYSALSDKDTTFFQSHMNGALQHHHPVALKASALHQNLPLPAVTFGHMENLCYATRHLEHPIPFTKHIAVKMTVQYSPGVKFNDPSANYVSIKKPAQNYANENYSQNMLICQPCLKSLHRKITM